jgi:hypothetical protein
MNILTNINIKIGNINFTIKKINLSEEYNNHLNAFKGTMISSNVYQRSLKLLATTSTQNYMMVYDWFDDHLNKPKKENLHFDTLKIYGIFPIDYDFSFDHINVTFSADYFEGDVALFEIQQLRKRKLLKIDQNCNATQKN